jgi:hypothetical protein
MRILTLAALVAFTTVGVPNHASASANGVGLGIAVGTDVARSKYNAIDVPGTTKQVTKATLSWGFFVDIPVAMNFYITPQTSIYELKLGDAGKFAVTDVDLNFKFLVPLGFGSLGAGLTAGLTAGLGEKYKGHYGALGILTINMVSNLDAFVLVQYKRLSASKSDPFDDIDNIHAYAGAMWKF